MVATEATTAPTGTSFPCRPPAAAVQEHGTAGVADPTTGAPGAAPSSGAARTGPIAPAVASLRGAAVGTGTGDGSHASPSSAALAAASRRVPIAGVATAGRGSPASTTSGLALGTDVSPAAPDEATSHEATTYAAGTTEEKITQKHAGG